MKFVISLIFVVLCAGCASVPRPSTIVSSAAAEGHLSRAGAYVDSAEVGTQSACASIAKITAAASSARVHAENAQSVLVAVREIQTAAASAQVKLADVGASLIAAKAERASATAALVELQTSAAVLERQEAQAVKDKQFAVARQAEIQKDRDKIAGRLNTLAGVLAIVAGLLAWSLFAHWTRGLETVAPWIGVGGPIAGGLFVGGAAFTYLRYLL